MLRASTPLLNKGGYRAAIIERGIDMHRVALAGAPPIKLGIMHDVDPRQEFEDIRISEPRLRELVDEGV